MTHVVGWTDGEHAYICADSAVTIESNLVDQNPNWTTFGEASVVSSNRRIDEGALKVAQFGSCTIGFAGDGNLIAEATKEIHQRLEAGVSATAALTATIQNLGPYTEERSFVALMATRDDGRVQILACDTLQGGGQLVAIPHNKTLLAGSGHTEFDDYCSSIIATLRVFPDATPGAKLAMALAALQRYCATHKTMEIGIGGAFAGVVIGPDGVQWQPDIAYVFYRSGSPSPFVGSHFAWTYVRDDVLVAVPSIGRSRIFGLHPQISIKNWREIHWPSSLREARSLVVDYVAYLDLAQERVVLVETQRHLEGQNFKLESVRHTDHYRYNFEHGSLLIKELLKPIPDRPGKRRSQLTHIGYTPGPFIPAV